MKLFDVKYKIPALLYTSLVILRTAATVPKNDEILYPAAELIRKNDYLDTFDVLRDYTKVTKELPKGGDLVYVCPAETDLEKELVQYSYLKDCWFIKKNSLTPLNSVWCQNDKKDQTMLAANYFFRFCGKNKRGIRYMFVHQVCWETNSWLYQYLVNIVSSPKCRRIKTSKIEIYTVCLSAQQPIYVEYTLNVRVPVNHENGNKIGQLSVPIHDFEQKEDLYHIPTEHVATIYKDQIIENDRLIPQFLFPLKHTKEDIASIAIHKYTNVNPMWQSLKPKWDRLDDEIAKLGEEYQHSHNFVIYAGTHEVIKNEEKKIMVLAALENPTNAEHSEHSENPTKPNYRRKLKVPLIWWKLVWSVTTNKGIIFAMQNTRKGEDAQLDKKLCTSICTDHGWLNINEPNDSSVYCCEYTAELKEKLELGQETISIDGILDRNLASESITAISFNGKLSETWRKFRPW